MKIQELSEVKGQHLGDAAKKAIAALEDEKLVRFVLITVLPKDADIDSATLHHSPLEQESVLGLLTRAAFIVNSE